MNDVMLQLVHGHVGQLVLTVGAQREEGWGAWGLHRGMGDIVEALGEYESTLQRHLQVR